MHGRIANICFILLRTYNYVLIVEISFVIFRDHMSYFNEILEYVWKTLWHFVRIYSWHFVQFKDEPGKLNGTARDLCTTELFNCLNIEITNLYMDTKIYRFDISPSYLSQCHFWFLFTWYKNFWNISIDLTKKFLCEIKYPVNIS